MEKTYRLIKEEQIAECGGTGRLYEHVKTGAKVFTLKNDDKNKVFLIGFRTTPKDSTGVAHIMEHSVLCGSEKYPIKDPFVELAKGSLNTFLNAMTYPDKTVYPVASVNDKDFMNLMDVYLDAVFHPNIYREEKIFRQEGWHYELSEDGELSINGVVYNEMKGVFSNPEGLLERYTMNALYPDTTYGFESGGDPADIPKLTYEDFIEFHKTYYHPSNSYIYLYGDLDMEEKLDWIDRNYLSEYEKKEVDSAIHPQKPFTEHRELKTYYAVSKGSQTEKKSYLSENFAIDAERGREMELAFSVLEFLLFDTPGAVLEEALIKAGIGEDVYGGTCVEIQKPYFSVVAKNADEKDLPRFRKVIKETLEDVVKHGFDKKSIEAAINSFEFKYREEDFGNIPRGLEYGLTMFDSWLYDGSPFTFLYYEDAFRSLREKCNNGFLEELIKKYLLNNEFSASVVISPKEGLTDEMDKKLKKELSEKLSAMSEKEKAETKKSTEELKKYQTREETEAELACLPVLSADDIEKQAERTNAAVKDGIIYSPLDTRGIAYSVILFDLTGLNADEIQAASFISSLLGEIDTKKHGYSELGDDILINTGGISFNVSSYMTGGSYLGAFTAGIKALTDKVDVAVQYAFEILYETVFDDEDRIIEKLFEEKSRLQMNIEYSSHMAAVRRALSYFNGQNRFEDLAGGIAYSDFLSMACRTVKEPVHRKRFFRLLRTVFEKMTSGKMYVSLTGNEQQLKNLTEALKKHSGGKPVSEFAESIGENKEISTLGYINEAMLTSSQVNYSALSGNFKKEGCDYSGAFLVLKKMLSYDYLWTNLRVLGGAYGCMCDFRRSGNMYLVSYRDPHIENTYEVYKKIPEYIRNKEYTKAEINKYIIGAISSLDHPETASAKSIRYLTQYFSGITDEELQKIRDGVLSCTGEDLRKLADPLEKAIKQNYICTIGNEQKLKEFQNKTETFGEIRKLYGED